MSVLPKNINALIDMLVEHGYRYPDAVLKYSVMYDNKLMISLYDPTEMFAVYSIYKWCVVVAVNGRKTMCYFMEYVFGCLDGYAVEYDLFDFVAVKGAI